MKKNILVALITAFLLFPALCSASFVIELKNGHRFVTEWWWKEGAIIKFYIYGGVVGLDRSTIGKIERSELKVAKAPAPVKKKDKAKPPDSEENSAESGETAKISLGPEQEQELREEKQLLDKENHAATAAFIKTKRSGDEAATKKARENLSRVETKKQTLREKIQKANNGNLPDWWDN